MSHQILYVVVNGNNNKQSDVSHNILGIYSSQKLAKIGRLEAAKKLIPDFDPVWTEYLSRWQHYHRTEYPDHPSPTNQLILEQFLSEDHALGIREMTLNLHSPMLY